MYRYHPTPSGCDRWILGTTTAEGYKSARQAAIAVNAAYPYLEQLDVNAFPDDAIANLAIPKGAEITVVTPHDGKDKPYVEVHEPGRLGKILPVAITFEQFQRLLRRKVIELDSSSGYDPDLSATYDHYFLAVA